MSRLIALIIGCLMTLFLLPQSAQAAVCSAEKPAKLAALDWESGQFTTALLAEILQTGYGCPTDIVPATGGAMESALIYNDLHIIAEQWVGRSPAMQSAEQAGKVKIVGNTLRGGATQGWYIPDYVQQQYGIHTLDDLRAQATLFRDPESPNKSRLLNCPTGWTCETFNSNLLNNTGLARQFNNTRSGTGAALDAEISAAYARREPIVFYYWQPTGLAAKFDMRPLAMPAYDAACWQNLLQPDDKSGCVSGFPTSQLGIAVATPFAQDNPELIALMNAIQFTPAQLNGAILDMTEKKRDGAAQAAIFLRDNPQVWQNWVTPAAAERLQAKFGVEHSANTQQAPTETHFFPNLSFSGSLNKAMNHMVATHGDGLRAFSQAILQHGLQPMERLLLWLPEWLILLLLALLAWHSGGSWRFAALCAAGFAIIGALGLWTALMQTLALLCVALIACVLIGLPLGILAARNERLYRALTPILDIVQTMPSFVYLIPVLMLFGIGKVPALMATVVYAVAPLIRLTALGIRQVDKSLIEMALSFGATRWQLLRSVLLPQAKPSILAGINQAVMMSLGMVVLASMIGARGLGEPVLQAVQTLNIGQGVEAGAAIVILAVVIDRITQHYGRGKKGM
ncbi:glycine betaine ABC transporter substrate-binding protein [Neisseriaceae bacterium B1]